MLQSRRILRVKADYRVAHAAHTIRWCGSFLGKDLGLRRDLRWVDGSLIFLFPPGPPDAKFKC